MFEGTQQHSTPKSVHQAKSAGRRTSIAAIRFFTAAVAIRPDSVLALNNLGFLESSAGRRAEAEALYREALGIIERTSGRKDQSYATALMNLATAAGDRSAARALVHGQAGSRLLQRYGAVLLLLMMTAAVGKVIEAL